LSKKRNTRDKKDDRKNFVMVKIILGLLLSLKFIYHKVQIRMQIKVFNLTISTLPIEQILIDIIISFSILLIEKGDGPKIRIWIFNGKYRDWA
jgi:hypothetical protein